MGKFLMGEENWLGINNEIPATGKNDNEFAEHGPPESGRKNTPRWSTCAKRTKYSITDFSILSNMQRIGKNFPFY